MRLASHAGIRGRVGAPSLSAHQPGGERASEAAGERQPSPQEFMLGIYHYYLLSLRTSQNSQLQPCCLWSRPHAGCKLREPLQSSWLGAQHLWAGVPGGRLPRSGAEVEPGSRWPNPPHPLPGNIQKTLPQSTDFWDGLSLAGQDFWVLCPPPRWRSAKGRHPASPTLLAPRLPSQEVQAGP